ncbi:protein phosphatase 1 regulatory subunit 37 [Nothobranchius furzeri]|uniref:Protein phosphatase 1 regulatory subunit 37 n=1 Tax=Nothobranchius furzeri TaxID=105023 RepID=A0A1A7ZTH0_NOTFU|nr:protein phosphatase 1 regulatory subunit 37 [Nothobranchius furzeri]KAF7218879.1 protein phosphatase 1 regulatory subunit 37 [Nothobranchius furzeri]
MNIEEQRIDLCNLKTQSNDATIDSEGVTPPISEIMTDGSTETQNIVPTGGSETYPMPQLTDSLQVAEKDNQQEQDALEIDEVNGNIKSCTLDPPVDNPTSLIFSNDEQHKTVIKEERMKEDVDNNSASHVMEIGDDGGDMDIGVDLSLDESGVLEAESRNVHLSSDNILDSESTPQDTPAGRTAESQEDADQMCSTEASVTNQAGLYPLVEEGDDKQKTTGKRVTFPSDDGIVSGAVEPKDPWRHAHNVTVEEILSSYKQACQKLNCKTIPKVLKQIQELKDLTQRNECLDLKGEKLDYKACESLEEILKRVQFKVIDLEQTNLDEDGASALFDMIEYYESATHLNISFNKHIGTRGWQAAAHMMRKTSSLQYLDARNTPLLDHSAPFVARALRISGSLAVLHLENAGLSGRPLMLLATALKMNMNLRELYLADNKLNGLQDSAQLGNLLKFNYNIQILDVRNNHILDSGLAYLCEGLKEQRKGLVTLVLWNNQLTHNGMGYLTAALPCTQSLETLNLGHNTVGNEGVLKLKEGLITNRSLLRLGLASTKLSCEGAVAVAEFIAESPRLLRLDLRENEIKTGGLMALSLALKVNNSLLRLDLDREPKKEAVKSFIETQRALLTEIQNGCKRNFIFAKEKEETEQKMRLSTSMAEIATEDGTKEEEDEESASVKRTEEGEKEQEDENKSQSSSQSEESSETSVPPTNQESDSDTEDEDEGEVVISSTPNSSSLPNQTAPQASAVASHSPLCASCTPSPPSTSPAGGPSVIPGITVTEATVPPGTPPSPGRCISVSSPGRGHKIFMVTRVESPPEQQQLQFQKSAPASALSHGKEVTGRPLDSITSTTQQILPPSTPQIPEDVNRSAPAPSAEGKITDGSPASRLESEINVTKSFSQSRTLDSAGAADPRTQTPALPCDSSSVQDEAQLPTEEVKENSKRPCPEPASVGGEEKEQDHRSVNPSECKEKLNEVSALAADLEQQTDQTSEEKLAPNQTETAPSQQGAPVSLMLKEKPGSAQNEEMGSKSEADPDPDSPVQQEESADESSADECFADALEGEVVGLALPNGLKPEFSLHLLDNENPKPGSCVMEHVSSSCGQELEELLLEASMDTGRDAS